MDNANSYDEIATLAYELYEKSGQVEGRDLDNWLEAERIVRARYAAKEKNEAEVINSSNMEYIGNERRRHKRLIVKGIQRNVPHSLNTKIINISVDGVAIETTKKLERNKEYDLRINHGGNALRLKGRVIWAILTRIEKKESGDIIPVYKAGMKFHESLLRISVR
ncbi:MAG TPA: DUF2934 domain-containing protein [Thermodesulfovibrionales bacterium]|nr:DUF2934 domain-containing protein [Thermodesulfovibrionales bacterium]